MAHRFKAPSRPAVTSTVPPGRGPRRSRPRRGRPEVRRGPCRWPGPTAARGRLRPPRPAAARPERTPRRTPPRGGRSAVGRLAGPPAGSHGRTVASPPAVAGRVPSGENTADHSAPWWPRETWSGSRGLRGSRHSTWPSAPEVTRRRPPGAKASPTTSLVRPLRGSGSRCAGARSPSSTAASVLPVASSWPPRGNAGRFTDPRWPVVSSRTLVPVAGSRRYPVRSADAVASTVPPGEKARHPGRAAGSARVGPTGRRVTGPPRRSAL